MPEIVEEGVTGVLEDAVENLPGRVAEADEEVERMLRLARILDHPASLAGALAFALHGGGVRHSYTGQMARWKDIATELRRLSHEEGFFL